MKLETRSGLLLIFTLLLVILSIKADLAAGVTSHSLGGIISGLVQDQLGNPLVGARVEIRCLTSSLSKNRLGTVITYRQQVLWSYFLSGSLSEKKSVTDYEGRYHLDSLPAGAYELVVLPPEDSSLAIQREIIGVLDGLTTRYDFTLQEGGEIRGWVRKPSGNPVEGLTIDLQKHRRVLRSVITDAEGQYRFTNISPDKYELGFDPPSEAEALDTLEVSVKAGEITIQNVTIVIEEPKLGRIAGRVETESEIPIPQADIYVWGLMVMDRIETDEEGKFLTADIPANKYTLIVVPPGDLPLVGKRITVSVPDGETIILKIILDKAGGISGQVLDEKGNPVAGAYIEANLRDANNNLIESRSDSSDPEGQYYIGGLTLGTYKIDVRPPDNLNLLKEQITGVEIRSGSNTNKDITLFMGGIISGMVTDELGEPVPDVRIQANGREAHTDVEGQYAMIGLPPAAYALKLSPPEGRNLLPLTLDNIELTTREAITQNFTLQAGGVVTGTVSDPGGNSIAGLEVEIEDDFLNRGRGRIIDIPGSEAKIWIFESQINKKTTTDHEGAYRFDTLPPGSYRIQIASPRALSFKGTEEGDIFLSLSETVIKDFTLLPTNLIQGEVIDHSKGAGQRDFIVVACEAGKPLEWDLEYSVHTLIEEASSYQIKDIPAGTYNLYLILETPDYSPYFSRSRILISKSPEIRLGSTQIIDNQNLEIELSGGGLSGQIAGRAKTVMALSSDGKLVGSTSIGQEGRYILAPLPEGKYTVEAILADGSSVVRSKVTVIKGVIMANIDLNLASPGTESNNQVSFNLDQVKVYPNPFYPDRTEWCSIAGIPSEAKEVKLRIYTIIGELVKDFEANEIAADSFGNLVGNCVKWDGRNDHGRACASGIYIYYLKCGQHEKVGKIALIR